ncbi:POTRA domain-containing protein [Hanstruepera ponticola]|uniref:POTRA domain-containing protein n=1 Tax=Hanstruepera ponticola TaxID=2042995 RepID=UPI001E50E7E7|nr:POTRA domain-containing protein [Hanstruepera ponticola]
MHKSLVLLLIIYAGFSPELIGQNLQLKINGSNNIETKVIDSVSYVKFHKDVQSIEIEIDTLKHKLQSLGYIEYKTQPLTRTNDTLFTASLLLGNKYTLIKIDYQPELVSREIIELISDDVTDSYFTMPFENIESSLEFINLKISETGFPFNEIKLSDFEKIGDNQLKARLTLKKTDQKRQIDKIIVKGYEKFPKSYLKHYLKLKKGNTLNLTKIKSKTNLLQDLQFASQIKEPEILFSKDSTILYIYVEKNKSNSFDGFLGFGTNEETNNLEFNGYLNLDLINNLNFGESFSLIYKSDENEQKTFNVKIALPYLFATPLGTELELNIFKKDSSFTTVNQNARIFYQLNPKNKFSLGIKSTQSTNLLDDENPDPFVKDYKSNIYNVRYEFLLRQNYSRLFRRNASIDFELGLGNRDIESTKTSQVIAQLDAFKILNLNDRNSIFLRIQGFSLFSENYLENELVRFGGINSIRGFEENSLSASFYSLLNTEYRYLLSNSVYIHSIIDLAYFENDITSQKDKLYGFGIGFGLLTKAGLLRLNYANGKNENQSFKFSNSQIHISLSAIF